MCFYRSSWWVQPHSLLPRSRHHRNSLVFKGDSVHSCLYPSVLPIFLGFNRQHNCCSQCCELGAHGKQVVNWRENQHKQSFCSVENSRKLWAAEPNRPPCESQPLSTLDGDELQLCDEQFTCHLEIHAQLLPMKQITGEKHNPTTESNQRTFSSQATLLFAPNCYTSCDLCREF